jgi:hypothetical protein
MLVGEADVKLENGSNRTGQPVGEAVGSKVA